MPHDRLKTIALNPTRAGDDPKSAAALEQWPLAEDDARELNEHLASLQSLLRQLLAQTVEKLDAIRQADTDRMERCAVGETELLEQVARTEQRRAAITARVAQDVPSARKGRLSLSELVDHLQEPLASVFRARNAALRQLATELQEKNALVARVARNLQTHIREIFAELAKVNQESVVYGPKGKHEQRVVRSWLDAVG